ncbi:MAG TPA: SAM-dependent methyltransferase [Jatrophihabitans sp.]|nr:SAM-dependent methyltransferase [Jatrophihabitans sp.]
MTEPDLDHLRRMYDAEPDPWRIGEGWYELRKRQLLVACLPERRYRNCFEPACGNGELSVLLADRCDRLLAGDLAEPAVERTALRLADRPGARARRLTVPADWPDEKFDLIVLSEFGYYLPWSGWQAVVSRTAASLTGDWTVLACHWLPDFAERQAGTDELHAELAARLPGRQILQVRDEDFRLDVFTGRPDSIAAREGRR